jgi:hypothetical protein
MSEIRDYLYAKACLPEGEWLRREPRTTHPAILAAVRAAKAEGLFYDDDIERYVETVAGDLPDHHPHGHESRNILTYQLGHEVYLAKGVIGDEQKLAEIEAAKTMGFTPVDQTEIQAGTFYLVRLGTLFSGDSVPTLQEPRRMKARECTPTQGWLFSEPRKQQRIRAGQHAMIRKS